MILVAGNHPTFSWTKLSSLKNSVKILGAHIDKNLRFREHNDYVTKS